MPDLLFWRVSPHGAPGGAKSGAAATAVGNGPSSDAGGNPWDADTVFAVEVKSEKERYPLSFLVIVPASCDHFHITFELLMWLEISTHHVVDDKCSY